MTNDIVMFATYVRPWSWSRIWVLVTLAELIHGFHSDGGVFALAGADPALLDTLEKYGTLTDFVNSHIYPTVQAAVTAFRTASADP